MLNNFEDVGKQMKNEHQLRAQQLAQEKGKHTCILIFKRIYNSCL